MTQNRWVMPVEMDGGGWEAALRLEEKEVERSLIGRTMTAVGGNQSEAARRLGVTRGLLIGRLRKYGTG